MPPCPPGWTFSFLEEGGGGEGSVPKALGLGPPCSWALGLSQAWQPGTEQAKEKPSPHAKEKQCGGLDGVPRKPCPQAAPGLVRGTLAVAFAGVMRGCSWTTRAPDQ